MSKTVEALAEVESKRNIANAKLAILTPQWQKKPHKVESR